MTIYEAAIRTVCTAFEITPQLLQGEDESRRFVEARQWYIMLTRRKPCIQAGRHIRRDHATVLHHRRKIKDLIEIYPSYREKWQVIQHLFDRIIADTPQCVSLFQYREQWKEYRDLLAAASAAKERLEALSTDIMNAPCRVQDSQDGQFMLCKKNLHGDGDPVTLKEVLSTIRRQKQVF